MNNGNERGVERPNSAGPWLWREAGHKDAVELLLTEDGGEVAGVDDAEEGTPQYYWERTPTDKRHMPGQWHLPPNARVDRPNAALCGRSGRTTGCASNGETEDE